MVTVKLKVYGKVQGVGFRYTTFELAHYLNLRGTVQNLSDGSVAIIVQGSANQLKAFLNKLNSFPNPYARINKIEKNIMKNNSKLSTFKII